MPGIFDYPCYVVVAFKSKLEMTGNLVDQILDQGGFNTIIMLDNGAILEPYPWAGRDEVDTLRRPGVNIHRMWNQGIDYAMHLARFDLNYDGPVNIAILNNDIVLESDNYLDRLASAMRWRSNVGLVTGVESDTYPDAEFVETDADGGLRANAIMIRGELNFRFDDRFFWYYGDTDLVAHIEQAGYRTGVAPRARHSSVDGGSVTLRTLNQELFYADVQKDERLFYDLKWPQIPRYQRSLPRQYVEFR